MKIHGNAEREIDPVFILNQIGKYAFDKINKRQKGEELEIITALLMCGLTLEALLNKIGFLLFIEKSNEPVLWGEIERFNPRKKLDTIIERLDLKVNFGELPFQDFDIIIKYRNRIVHGKYEKIEKHGIEIEPNINMSLYDNCNFQSDWEKQSTVANVKRWRNSVSAIANVLCDKVDILNPLEIANWESWGTS